MCDYSLMMVPNRLAAEGEELVSHRFRSGSVGLVSCADYSAWNAECKASGWWKWFRGMMAAEDSPKPVVCIPCGAQLRMLGIPKNLQRQLSVTDAEDVTFRQVTSDPNRHRDALCFENGVVLSIQSLDEGQKLRVIRLSAEPDNEIRVDEPEIVYSH
jgi:hypothetical protein